MPGRSQHSIGTGTALNLGYSTITRWLREFREKGMPGLFSETLYHRGAYPPERVIVQLIFFKCCAPKAGDRELARVIHHLTGHQLHHLTVKSLCERFFFWRHPEFQQLVRYPVPTDPQALRLKMVRLSQQGWTEVRIAELLRINRKTVRKWLRRAQQQSSPNGELQLPLMDLSRAPHRTSRNVYLGTIHAVLELQKKYGYAGYFRIKGYLEGLSRTILAGSLTTQQEVGLILHAYFQALLRWGLWEEVISDPGGQFISHDLTRVNK